MNLAELMPVKLDLRNALFDYPKTKKSGGVKTHDGQQKIDTLHEPPRTFLFEHSRSILCSWRIESLARNGTGESINNYKWSFDHSLMDRFIIWTLVVCSLTLTIEQEKINRLFNTSIEASYMAIASCLFVIRLT